MLPVEPGTLGEHDEQGHQAVTLADSPRPVAEVPPQVRHPAADEPLRCLTGERALLYVVVALPLAMARGSVAAQPSAERTSSCCTGGLPSSVTAGPVAVGSLPLSNSATI